VFVLVDGQAEGAGEGVDNGQAGPCLLAAFETGVVVDADASEGGQFLPRRRPGVRRGPGPGVSPACCGVIWVRRARKKSPNSPPVATPRSGAFRQCRSRSPLTAAALGGSVIPRNASPRHILACHGLNRTIRLESSRATISMIGAIDGHGGVPGDFEGHRDTGQHVASVSWQMFAIKARTGRRLVAAYRDALKVLCN
jgi:hypothetical protein